MIHIIQQIYIVIYKMDHEILNDFDFN